MVSDGVGAVVQDRMFAPFGTLLKAREPGTQGWESSVVADALQVGVVAAAGQHGVPQSCVSRWSSEVRLAAARPQRVAQQAPPTAAKEPAPVEPPARVSRRYTPSERALVVEYAAREGVTAAAEKYGPSRYTIYQWQRQVAKAAAGGGRARSRISYAAAG